MKSERCTDQDHGQGGRSVSSSVKSERSTDQDHGQGGSSVSSSVKSERSTDQDHGQGGSSVSSTWHFSPHLRTLACAVSRPISSNPCYAFLPQNWCHHKSAVHWRAPSVFPFLQTLVTRSSPPPELVPPQVAAVVRGRHAASRGRDGRE